MDKLDTRRLSPEAREELRRAAVRMFKRGRTHTAIAEELVVSRSTVKFHVSNILSKLGAASRTEAVRIAIEHNLVT